MKLVVLGGGSWGITLAHHLRGTGHSVSLWEHDAGNARTLIETRGNDRLIPGVRLAPDIRISNRIADVLPDAGGVVFAVPTHGMRSTADIAAALWPDDAWAVSVSKGLEGRTHLRMSQVLETCLPPGTPVAALSGPSHAEEVSQGIPTTLVAASSSPGLAARVQDAFHSPTLRVYTSSDLIGVELGGALKNIIAIAAGILDGLGMGDNTKAALMTRGLHEITRLGVALGAQEKTFSGLTGMGDLVVTCMSRHSRNRLIGEKIGAGANLSKALSEMVMVAEGVGATRAAHDLAALSGVEVPITTEVHRVLFEDKPAARAVKDLFARSAKPEHEAEGEAEPDV
jgi:glycerol-3-phosphate dehydrogenase (NAD(P)+)